MSVSTSHTNAEAQAQSEQTQENEIVWVLVLIMIQWDHHCTKYREVVSEIKTNLLITIMEFPMLNFFSKEKGIWCFAVTRALNLIKPFGAETIAKP